MPAKFMLVLSEAVENQQSRVRVVAHHRFRPRQGLPVLLPLAASHNNQQSA
jgi:hypothetical protein